MNERAERDAGGRLAVPPILITLRLERLCVMYFSSETSPPRPKTSMTSFADLPRDRSGGSPQPRARDRILALLRDVPGEPWCAECVAMKLSLPRARVANVFLAAEGITGFRRQDACCAGCGRRRLGLVRVKPPAPTDVAEALDDVDRR